MTAEPETQAIAVGPVPPFKNWLEICKIPDRNLRIALILCSTPELLAKLQIAFPECFSQAEVTLRIPKSAIIEKANEEYEGCIWAKANGQLGYNWLECNLWKILQGFGMPREAALHLFPGDANPVTEQVLGKLIEPTSFFEVTWRDIQWIVCGLGDAYPERPYNPKINRGNYATLIPKEFIDLSN